MAAQLDMADLSLYPMSAYKNDEHNDLLFSVRATRPTTPKIGETELQVRGKNKAEKRLLDSYCSSVDSSSK